MDKLKSNKEPLVLAENGRHDCMGHSAKYCAYTIFCCTEPAIINLSRYKNKKMFALNWIKNA